jgi:hypothetical protein
MPTTEKDVYSLVNESGTIVKEVFSSVVGSESKATRNAAVTQLDAYCKEVLRAHPEWAPIIKGISPRQALVQRFEAREIVALIDAADSRLHRHWLNQAANAFPALRALMVEMAAYLYELDAPRLIELRASDPDQYKDVGLGIVLAGIYLSLQD